MPTLNTRGAASRYGFNTGLTPAKYTGSFGIFVTAAANSPVVYYGFATNASAVITNLGTPEQYYGAAAGTGTKAILFMAGIAAPFNTTKRYIFADATTSPGTNLTQSLSAGTAIGNTTQAIVMLAYGDVVTNKYIYGSDSVSTGTSLTVGAVYIGSFGNANYGITQIGTRGGSGNNKYTYAGDVVTSQAAFSTVAEGDGCCIPTLGIMAFSLTSGLLKYVMATGAISTGPTLGGTIGAGCGNIDIAVFSRSNDNTSSVYTYAADTFAAGSALGSFSVGSIAVSNGVTGINI